MKKVQIIWSDEALIDLEIIYDFLADKSQQSAQRIIESLLERVKQLEIFPESGAKQVYIKSRDKEYRYLVEDHYKIIYSYQSDNQIVYIQVIFDTRYNPEKLEL